MFIRLLTLLLCVGIISGKHFNGGTITWAPINPYSNSSTVSITITQSYSWTYPYITCAANVPISTSGRSGQNSNLTCVVDCSTDGGYSSKPIDILTDCTSSSTSLGMMSSTRSHNLTLNASAHFYLAFVGSAWVGLDSPAQNGLQWSIVTFIDLRMRPDGFLNTPPVASVVSPQYAIVNRTVQINIPVSDVNAGDDVRCRWSTYTAGYRRRKRWEQETSIDHPFDTHHYKNITKDGEVIHRRQKRLCFCPAGTCTFGCLCACSACDTTICTGVSCGLGGGCTTPASTTTAATTTTIATTVATTTIATTTVETQGTLKSTSSYPHRQALDECGGICYPNTVPSGTSISNCTISFTGLTAGVWYAVAIQVEDFINETSTTPMSSVPVQLLIYVLPTPSCPKPPIIFPLSGCLEVQVGITISFDLYAMNLCNPSVANITDLIVSAGINGMTTGNLTRSPTNSSLSYVHFTWTPQVNQIGLQELCTIAYTSELEQSTPYCVTFTVKATPDLCVTTTTTSTTSTSATTTTTTQTTTTSSSSTTSVSTTTTTETTTTSTTSTSTTTTTSTETSTTSSTTSSSTSSTSTSSSTTSSTTSTTSSSTSSTSTSSSTTSTTTSTTSSSTSSTSTSSTTSTSTTSSTTSTSSTSTSTTTTSVTTTTATTSTVTTATTTQASGSSINWPLIVGLSLLAAAIALCCCCYCLYRFCWSPAARRRRRKGKKADIGEHVFEPRCATINPREIQVVGTANKTYRVYDKLQSAASGNSSLQLGSNINSSAKLVSASTNTFIENDEKRGASGVSVRKVEHVEIENLNDTENLQMKSSIDHSDDGITLNSSRSEAGSVRVTKISKRSTLDDDQTKSNSNLTRQQSSKTETLSRAKTVRVNVVKASRSKTASIQPYSSLNVIHENMPNLEMQSTGNRLKTATDNKTKTISNVIVKKLRRASSIARSDPSAVDYRN